MSYKCGPAAWWRFGISFGKGRRFVSHGFGEPAARMLRGVVRGNLICRQHGFLEAGTRGGAFGKSGMTNRR